MNLSAARLISASIIIATTTFFASASEGVNRQQNEEDNSQVVESLFPNASASLAFSHFTWGVEVGSAIDLSGTDLSTFNADVILGYKNDYIRTVGIGAGIHRAFGNGDNFIPLYIIFRSSFRTRPSLFFLHLKAGYSFNSIQDSPIFGNTNGAIGLGINLAMSKKFMSHIILGYEFRHFTKNKTSTLNLPTQDISLAMLSFGINF